MLFGQKEHCLVDEDSDQPALDGAFAAAIGWIARGSGAQTVFHRVFGILGTVEDAAADEIKQFVIAREVQFERASEGGARLAVGF